MVKTIAYYLPQFHTIKENDLWWGKGFTEWTNVRKAQPIFTDHYQPKIPFEYYDLSNSRVIENQISIAKKFGLFGFCFHYYWFAGKRLLEKPIEQFLENRSPSANFPFMLCWANENWTRKWDGKENEILIRQRHSSNDNKKVCRDLLRFFNDERYIKVNEKPALIIYRPEIIPNFDKLIQQLRDVVQENGFPNIHIIATNSFGFSNKNSSDINAIAEFPPHHVTGKINFLSKKKITGLDINFKGKIFDYNFFRNASIENYRQIMSREKTYAYYPGTFPSWDNTARTNLDSSMFIADNSTEFYKWLVSAMKFSTKYNTENDNFVFINSWNEWAEGAYLEPDTRHGFENLNALKIAIENFIR